MELMNKSLQLIHPIGHDRSRQNRSMREELIFEKRNISQSLTVRRYSLVNSTKDDRFVRNTANAYWQTVHVYARSKRYAIDYSGKKKNIACFDELINFSKRRPSMCLIARVADNLMNFEAAVKKKS